MVLTQKSCLIGWVAHPPDKRQGILGVDCVFDQHNSSKRRFKELTARKLRKTQFYGVTTIATKLEQQGEEVNKRYQTLTNWMKLQETLVYELTEKNINNLLQFREIVAIGLNKPAKEKMRQDGDIIDKSHSIKWHCCYYLSARREYYA